MELTRSVRPSLRLQLIAAPLVRTAVLGLMAALAPAAALPQPGPPPDALDRIQRECLRAYPPGILAEMASGAQEIPAEVESAPNAQMQFLDKEVPLEKGLFYPILLEDLLPVFRRYVGAGTRFLDLGSGDGRAVFLASVLGAEATGIEYDREMVETSRRALEALDDLVDPDRVEILRGDFFEASWAGYDVIYFFDQSSFEPERVREKMQRELDPGARLLLGHEQAPFPGLEVEERFSRHPRHPPVVTVYRRPEETSAEPSEAKTPPR